MSCHGSSCGQSSRGLEHSKTLRANSASACRFGLRQSPAAFASANHCSTETSSEPRSDSPPFQSARRLAPWNSRRTVRQGSAFWYSTGLAQSKSWRIFPPAPANAQRLGGRQSLCRFPRGGCLRHPPKALPIRHISPFASRLENDKKRGVITTCLFSICYADRFCQKKVLSNPPVFPMFIVNCTAWCRGRQDLLRGA